MTQTQNADRAPVGVPRHRQPTKEFDMATETESTARTSSMAYEWQSDARVWFDLGRLESRSLGEPLKLTITEAASLYREIGFALREYVSKGKDIEAALVDEVAETELSR